MIRKLYHKIEKKAIKGEGERMEITNTQIIEELCRTLLSKMQPVPDFPAGNIPVTEAAQIMHKSPDWVKAGMIAGWFPVGVVIKDGVKITSLKQYQEIKGRAEFVIFPRKFWEITGYRWKGSGLEESKS